MRKIICVTRKGRVCLCPSIRNSMGKKVETTFKNNLFNSSNVMRKVVRKGKEGKMGICGNKTYKESVLTN